MRAVESGRVCNMSPANTAADFGTSLPFNQAAPLVYSMADAVSPASITCAGNRIASKQHTADRSLDCDMVRVTPAFLGFSIIVSGYGLPVNAFVRFLALPESLAEGPSSRPSAGEGT